MSRLAVIKRRLLPTDQSVGPRASCRAVSSKSKDTFGRADRAHFIARNTAAISVIERGSRKTIRRADKMQCGDLVKADNPQTAHENKLF
jgi:hypothetical protein